MGGNKNRFAAGWRALRIASLLVPVVAVLLVSAAAPAAPVSVPADLAPFVTDDYRFDPEAYFAAGRSGPVELPAGIRMYPGALTRVPTDGRAMDRPLDDTNWSPSFSVETLDGTVRAMTAYQDGFAVGGDFVIAGGRVANHVAFVHDREMRVLGTGTNGRVLALAVYNGDLIAAGEFTSAGGVAASRIARWDGTQWLPLGSGTNAPIHALRSFGGELWAGGQFTEAGGVAVSYVARWDGIGWQAAGSGTSDWVRVFAEHGSQLYVGGDFVTASGVTVNRVARWDGSAFEAVGLGFNGPVFALASYGGQLCAGGMFTLSGSATPTRRTARWTGAAWSPIGAGFDDFVWALEPHDGELLAGGAFSQLLDGSSFKRVGRWNGVTWSPLDSGTNGTVWALASVPLGVAVAGAFTLIGVDPLSRLAIWSSDEWTGFNGGMDDDVRCFGLYQGQLFVGGKFNRAGGITSPAAVRWVGEGWSATPGLADRTTVTAFAEIGGEWLAAGEEDSIAGLWLWDGTNWVRQPVTVTYGTFPGPSIFDFVEFDGQIYIAGRFTGVDGVQIAGIARQDGAIWTDVGGGLDVIPAGAIWGLTVYDGSLIVGGDFTAAGGVPTDHVARWDGAAWHAMGAGLNARVRDFTVYNGSLIAGGLFSQSGAVAVKRVARWDGAAWHEIGGGGLPGAVRSLTVLGSELVAAGAFIKQLLSEDLAVNVARWNGSGWNQLGSGLGAPAIGAFANGNELWVGGPFVTAGLKSSFHIARWDESASSAPPRTTTTAIQAPRALHVDVFPNPAFGPASFRMDVVRGGRVAIDVYDVAGRRMARVLDEVLPVGQYVRPWDGRDRAGRMLPAGVYFYRVSGDVGTAKGKLVRTGGAR